MKASIKAKWVKALRSGKYAQGHLELRTRGCDGEGDEFCCLGVLCDLHSQSKAGKRWGSRGSDYSYSRARSYCPPVVLKWAGLPTNEMDPVIHGEHASELNDTASLTFKEIANLIEKHL